jgi:desulfoferrodoxin (superoxide reductase-like protein)
MNDVVFGEDLVKKITSKLKKGTHLISFEENGLDIKNEIEVEVSWIPLPVKFKHYII